MELCNQIKIGLIAFCAFFSGDAAERVLQSRVRTSMFVSIEGGRRLLVNSP